MKRRAKESEKRLQESSLFPLSLSYIVCLLWNPSFPVVYFIRILSFSSVNIYLLLSSLSTSYHISRNYVKDEMVKETPEAIK